MKLKEIILEALKGKRFSADDENFELIDLENSEDQYVHVQVNYYDNKNGKKQNSYSLTQNLAWHLNCKLYEPKDSKQGKKR